MARPSELPSLAVRRPTLIVVINLLIVLAGLGALFGVEVRELPSVDWPVVTVRAFWDGASPETMDAEVTSVIEGAVARVPGIKKINAASEENNARVRAIFMQGVPLDVAANDVREAVAAIERSLPDGVDEVTVVKADSDASSIISIGVVSNRLSQEALTHIAEEDVASEFTTIPGVATVGIFGRQKKVLRVVVDPLRLASYGLSVDEVAEVLQSTNLDVPAGSFKSDDHLLLVRADATIWRPTDIEALELRGDIRLGDVARAFYGPAEAESYALLNGRRVIVLDIVRRAGSNTIEISAAVDQAIERLNRRFKDVELVKIVDDADFIRVAVREVLISLAAAVFVVIAVIFAFMGALRPTLIPATAIPVALIGTIAAIWLLGFSVNILTLLALVLATGMIVDDAIVVVENVQRKRREGLQPLAAAVVGTREVFFAVLATTITLVSVFVPIAFLPGTAGRLFAEFGFVLAVAVAISSFVALTLGCMLSSRLNFGDGEQDGVQGTQKRGLMKVLGAASTAGYRRLLDFTLSARILVLTVAVALAGYAIHIYPTIDEELLPVEDRGSIQVLMQGPDGVDLDYMDRQGAKVEAMLQTLRSKGEATNVLSIVGRWDLNRVYLIAPLVPWSERERTQQEIAAELAPQLKTVTGATTRIRSSNSLNLWRSGGSIEFALTGPKHSEIAAAANDFLSVMRDRTPQFEDPEVEFQQTQPQLNVQIDRRRAEDLDIPIEGIVDTLRAMIDGFEVAELNVNDRVVPIMLESAAGAIRDPSDLHNLFVSSREGRLVPLSAFVTLRESGVAAELDRTGQKRAVEIQAGLPQAYPLRQAITDIEQAADGTLPPGIGLRMLNEASTLQDTSNEVAIIFAVAILVVLLVLAAQFESFVSALVILLTVPFGLAAAIFALKLTGSSLNIYSEIGLIMLIGLMAKNGILVVEFADQQRDRGLAVGEAIRLSAMTRLRPVMMTMLSTVLGALPLVLASGAGAEARMTIGWVVFGGLGIATIFTLILIPVIYSLLAPLVPPRAHAGVRLDRELREITPATPLPLREAAE